MDTIENSQLAGEPPIFRLSPALRRQIYSHFHHALGRMPCNLHLHGGNIEATFGIPALLLSCRRIYDEVVEVLYPTNSFDIKCEGAGSLQRIRNLSDTSLSLLTELKIVLNEESCHHESCTQCCDDYSWDPEGCCGAVGGHKRLHDQALRPSDDSANNLLGDWKLAAAYIWRRVRPRKLNISFVCDFDPRDPRTFGAARLAMAPLINLSPLRDCHIRLSRRPNRELEQIARNSVLRACGIVGQEEPTPTLTNASAESGSMLMSLPRELRFRVLEYTDLITPWIEIEWSQSQKRYLKGHTWCGDEQLACGTGGHHACQFKKCWTDFMERDSRYRDPRPRVGCFCRVRHAAFSFNCRCWSPPTDLLLVCRAFCKDAQVVFFSGNRFLVHDSRTYNRTGNYLFDRYPVVEFLRDVVPVDCVDQIRSLEISMHTMHSHDSWPREGSRVLSEWKDTVQFMKEKMNMEGLNLDLYLGDSRGPTAQRFEGMTRAQVRELLQAYFRILAPLAGLGEEGLKAFSVYISLPPEMKTTWHLDRRLTGVPRCAYEAWGQTEQILRESAERLVMGSRSRCSEQPEGGFYWSNEEPEDDFWHYELWF